MKANALYIQVLHKTMKLMYNGITNKTIITMTTSLLVPRLLGATRTTRS